MAALPGPRAMREANVNLALDVKERLRQLLPNTSTTTAEIVPRSSSGQYSARLSVGVRSSGSQQFIASQRRHSSSEVLNGASPGVDRRNRFCPMKCPEIAADVIETFYEREKTMNRSATYLTRQPEVTEKMRMILVDWLIDVHLKFKLHPETFYLCVDIVDRYLSVASVARSQLQLVGICAIFIAAKHDEIWPPEVRDCIHISANSYSREELLHMERAICTALQFKFTTPNSYPFLARLLDTVEADDQTRHTAMFFLEHAALQYGSLKYLPSQNAAASLLLANVMLGVSDPWNYTLQYYSKVNMDDVRPAAKELLEYTTGITTSKYQAIRRKYSSPRFCEVSRKVLPTTLPLDV